MLQTIMDRTRRKLVQAGWLTFGRFGISRATMPASARQAGASRQTIQNAFESKEDLPGAGICDKGQESPLDLGAAWQADRTLERKPATVHRFGPLTWVTEVGAAPDRSDPVQGLNTTAAEELAQIVRAWVAMPDDMPGQRVRAPDTRLAPTRDVSRFYYASSKKATDGSMTPRRYASR